MNTSVLVLPARRPAGAIALMARHRVLATIGVLLVFPWLMPNPSVASTILIYAVFALGFNFLFGYMGMLSFGHAAFLGVGGYTAGILIAHFQLPWWVAIPAAVALAALVALAMGMLAIRTRGIYFAMVTLALSQCVYFAVYQLPLSGGENGLRGVNLDQVGPTNARSPITLTARRSSTPTLPPAGPSLRKRRREDAAARRGFQSVGDQDGWRRCKRRC